MVKEKQHRVQVAPTSAAEATENAISTPEQTSRISFLDNYAAALAEDLETRNLFQIMEKSGSIVENLTPVFMEDTSLSGKLLHLTKRIARHDVCLQPLVMAQTSTQKLGITTKTSMDDITTNIASTQSVENVVEQRESEDEMGAVKEVEAVRVQPFIKIVLRKTKEILFFEQRSTTVLRGSDEAQQVEEDNKNYDYITVGKGRVRRTDTAEAQTTDILYKSRDANTQSINTATVVSYVSNFEMFDTYRNLETETTSVAVGDTQRMSITTYRVGGVDQFEVISKSRNFMLALMVTLRILAGNVFEQQQRRFRNMIMPDPMSRDINFRYSLNQLFTFHPLAYKRERRAVVDIAFCPSNGDIIAVAYGIFTYFTTHVPENGYCCVWNIKNPVNPERVFSYDKLVVSVQFSPFIPQLLAIGLYDGHVEVRDITNFDDPPIAVSQRTETSTCDPIIAIEWLPQMSASETMEIEPLLTLSQDTSVTKYRIINSPYLLGYHQIQLDRVEGSPEGLAIKRTSNQAQSNRHPQGKKMILHPRQHDVYFILTDEGCIHKCSTNHPHQHLEVLQVHEGAVNMMDFSPWSPKLFLTAGNDWCIRIWIEGIFEPLITLKSEIGPIHCAGWSKTHSTVIVSITRKIISIWDIRRSILKPVSTAAIDKSHYTLFQFSRCGRSIAVGNERGDIKMLSFEDMPFPPHFQYNELELAIYRAIDIYPVLTTELKSIGFFGYPDQRRARRCN